MRRDERAWSRARDAGRAAAGTGPEADAAGDRAARKPESIDRTGREIAGRPIRTGQPRAEPLPRDVVLPVTCIFKHHPTDSIDGSRCVVVVDAREISSRRRLARVRGDPNVARGPPRRSRARRADGRGRQPSRVARGTHDPAVRPVSLRARPAPRAPPRAAQARGAPRRRGVPPSASSRDRSSPIATASPPRGRTRRASSWCPEVYFDARRERLFHVESAIKRGKQLKCSHCGIRGATVGCTLERCPRSYHLACAHAVGCRFNADAFTVTCLVSHKSHKRTPAPVWSKTMNGDERLAAQPPPPPRARRARGTPRDRRAPPRFSIASRAAPRPRRTHPVFSQRRRDGDDDDAAARSRRASFDRPR